MGKRARAFEVKRATVLGTLVFEHMGEPAQEREFRYADLRRWGYDLAQGTRSGRAAHFLMEADEAHRAGDRFEAEGEHFAVERVLGDLPGETRLLGSLEMLDGVAMLSLGLEGAVEERVLWRVPAAELLLYYLSKHGLNDLLAALQDVGRLTALSRSRGQEGRARGLGELSPRLRRFVREARSDLRQAGVGRLTVADFGSARDGHRRYRVGWTVPTLALFDIGVGERIDRLLGALD